MSRMYIHKNHCRNTLMMQQGGVFSHYLLKSDAPLTPRADIFISRILATVMANMVVLAKHSRGIPLANPQVARHYLCR